jgi:N-acetylglucosaminyl-diphospho-decaprenol L-rhamnosyltransferase
VWQTQKLARAASISYNCRVEVQADAIVVAFQSEDVLEGCVRSLRRDPAVKRIIVVNNSPGDGSSRAVEKVPNVDFIESADNVGFGRAINHVRHLITSPWVVLANPDTTQSDDTITATLQFLEAQPLAALVGPRLFTPDGKLDRNSKHGMNLLRMIAEKIGGPERLQGSRSRADHEHAHLSEYVIGSFVVCRRIALDQVGWFDERIFLFGEDQDLCRRLRAAGWEVWYAPVGKVIHSSGHSWRQLDDEGQAHFRTSRRRELRADAGRLAACAYPLLEWLSGRMARRSRDRP